MNRRVDQPAWLVLVRSPGVVPVLRALYSGPLGYLPLCAHLPGGRGGCDAASALRCLASFGMVRRHVCGSRCGYPASGAVCPGPPGCAGSWDQPDPAAAFELTDRGQTFAGLWFDLLAILSERPRR